MGVTSLAAQPVCLGPVKRASCADFVLKSRTTLYRHFLQQIFEKRANLSCCKTGLNVVRKTRNVAIQLVLRQCCKTRSCTFLLPVSPHHRQFLYVQEFLILSSSPQKPKRPFSICFTSFGFILLFSFSSSRGDKEHLRSEEHHKIPKPPESPRTHSRSTRFSQRKASADENKLPTEHMVEKDR